MASLHRKRGPMHEINVVPYIDVMLVLLVIFMITAPLVTPGVVDLPSVSKASNAPVQPLEVVVKQDQSIIVRLRGANGAIKDERQVSRGELPQVIREFQAGNPDQPVLIAADKNVRYQSVLDVMSVLQEQHVEKVGLLVKPAR